MNEIKPVNILLVDDNLGDIRLAEEAFKEGKVNIRLHVVMDGEDALRYLRRQLPYENAPVPSLILLDLNLPRMDGREVLVEIKADPCLRSIPVVILSTSVAESDIQKSYDLHVNCYINKPLDYDRFFVIIQRIEEFWLKTAILPHTYDDINMC